MISTLRGGRSNSENIIVTVSTVLRLKSFEPYNNSLITV